MKRLFSLLLALVMVLSLAVTAFATDEIPDETEAPADGGNSNAATGTITIINATRGVEYKIYKLFNASYDPKVDSVSYTIDEGSQFMPALFDEDGNPTAKNVHFLLNTIDYSISRSETFNRDEMLKFVGDLVKTPHSYTADATASLAANAENDTLVFENVPYGYYLITSAVGTAVTVNSNTPDIEVYDKNQAPATIFQKKIWNPDVRNEDGTLGAWDDKNTAAVGDVVKYQVTFNATNYDGAHLVKYYSVIDSKGSGLWTEFGKDDPTFTNNISITLTDATGRVTELKRGYYVPFANNEATNTKEWEYLGDWTGATKDKDNAQWYLVHMGFDEFRITIPWLSDYELTVDEEGVYTLEFGENARSLYDASNDVEIIYYASVEYNAEIGGDSTANHNTASLRWIYETNYGSHEEDTVHTNVFGMGIHKTDAKTDAALQGAEFALYTDAACTTPLYVIPTNVEGVYIKDDLNTPGSTTTGSHMNTARKIYEAYLEDYLKDEKGNPVDQKNVVTTPVNGKAIVLGLDAGTYYLRETKAPNGYNALSSTVNVQVDDTTDSLFLIFADGNGKVDDLQDDHGAFAETPFYVTAVPVANSQGTELPSTGGEGAIRMITIGTLIAMAFAVLLITHKKMSVYHD